MDIGNVLMYYINWRRKVFDGTHIGIPTWEVKNGVALQTSVVIRKGGRWSVSVENRNRQRKIMH